MMESTQPQIYLNPEPKIFPTLQWNSRNVSLVLFVVSLILMSYFESKEEGK